MERSNLSATIFIIAITVIPIVWLIVHANRKKIAIKRAVKEFQKQYGKYNSDSWLNAAIIISADKKNLRFVRQDGKETSVQDISINEISKCLAGKNLSGKIRSEGDSQYQTLDIALTTNSGEKYLTFYSSNFDGYTALLQTQYLEKWKKLIGELVK